MITIIKKIKVYGPAFKGIQDILLIGGKIAFIGSDISADFQNGIEINTMDGEGKIALPGFIDSHVHMLGGGGEGGYKTRTPEIMLSDLTCAGITTAVGCLGTDGVTRNMMSLLAKANGLDEEGITTFIYTGSYQIPVKTLTGGIIEDLLAIDKIIGVGEIALSDHRSSQPSYDEFVRTAADVRVGGMLSGKAGVLDIHLGDGERGIEYVFRAIEETEIPITQFLPTHINRNPHLFEQGLNFARKGGYIDFTGSEDPQFSEQAGEVSFGKGVKRLLEEGISNETFTLSSDAQGSLPVFNENNEYIGLGVGSAKCLWTEICHAVLTDQIPLEIAIKGVTANPAKILKLQGKGRLEKGYDADLCIINEATMEIDTVFAKGQLMVKQKEPMVLGTFEKR